MLQQEVSKDSQLLYVCVVPNAKTFSGRFNITFALKLPPFAEEKRAAICRAAVILVTLKAIFGGRVNGEPAITLVTPQ